MRQKSKAESDYNKQMDTLAEKFAAVETESKLLKQAMENQRKAMEIDSLTSLPNRFAFNERFKKELATLSVTSDPICLCIGDVDDFDQLNKRFGLNAGDKALQLITKQMQKFLESDDFLARYSADKFVLIMPLKTITSGLKTIQDICANIRQAPFKCKNENINITVSFGITELVRSDEEGSAFKRASEALISAKNAGGDDCYSLEAV
jgi:diguanylate cyclase